MKIRNLFLVAVSFCLLPMLHGQELKPLLDRAKAKFQLKPMAMPPIAPAAFLMPSASTPEWDFSLANIKGIYHPGSPEKEAIRTIKQEKLTKKFQDLPPNGDPQPEGVLLDPPVMNLNFQGNLYNLWYPSDNHMAISNSGFIVSVVNSSIYYYAQYGAQLFNKPLGDFFSFLNLGSDFFYDTRVLYDAGEDKFIFVALFGNTPSASRVVVSFSKSGDPADGWWSYVFDGNFLDNNTWFDFPTIGVSNEDLFITGNLYDPNDGFNQCVILQIDKQPGFTGGTVNWEYFNNVTDGFGNQAASIVPASYGFDGGYGPGIYLVSTNSGGSNFAYLYEITGNVEDNQDIFAYSVETDPYSPSADAGQQGTNKFLNTDDCRVRSAFYADGIIHYVHHTDFEGTGYTSFRYNRLDVDDQIINYVTYGQTPYDYAYPSVAPIGAINTDKSVIVGFLRSSANSYPEFRATHIDEAFDVSASIQIKSGESYLDVTADNVQRWGDYSGISRKQNSPVPVVWVFGCYGKSNHDYGNWIGQLTLDPEVSVAEVPNIGSASVFPNPVQDVFTLELELKEKTYLNIFLSDVNGRVVHSMFQGRAKAGINRLSFNKGPLAPGMYFLTIQDETQNAIRQEKIVVAD